jgi:enoyl-[acyl-carrier protein] reductase II
MEAAIPLSGEVAGRIESVKSVQEIIDETVSEFRDIMQELAGRYVT